MLLTVTAIACNDKIPSDKMTAENVFASLKYGKVIAYNYDGEGDIEIIDEKMKLAPKVKKAVQLSKRQVITITNIFCSKSSYGGPVAACFDPHFGVVFYKASKPIAYVSVCLECNYLESSIKIPQPDGRGFSERGAKNIIEFENEINLFKL